MKSWISRLNAKHPYFSIVAKSTFTLFNLVNVILAVMVALVGSWKNMLFIFIALANTLISIINNVRAQKMIDKLKLTAEQLPTVERDGRVFQVKPEEVLRGDLVILSLGDQILYDSVLEDGLLEVNEAFITGEQDNIEKKPGDKLISGSFVVAGQARAKVTAVGAENSLDKISAKAHEVKTADSQLFTIMNKIVRYISYALIPIGALLLWSRFRTEADTVTAVTSTVAALINMIPEGLILLTSSVLALATIRLSRKKVLVQDMYSIETLARVDTICLDKTGTLTTGHLTVRDFLTPDGESFDSDDRGLTPAQKSFLRALASLVTHQMGENATITALKAKLARGAKFGEIDGITEVVPFSSERKWSGIRTRRAEYRLGALEFLTSDPEVLAKKPSGTDRVLAVMENEKLLGFVRLTDEIRADAPEIIRYFNENEVDVKIISGDDLAAVSKIAEAVGVKDLRGIELSGVKKLDYDKIVKDYSIFTRVTPEQKQKLVKALQKQGRTVAMTGDGVNDILAMKEADCSLAIGNGADAARRAARMVLLNSDFAAVPAIIREGRQSINNLERSASLFLTKTFYASILAVVFVVAPIEYPFIPIEMSLLNTLCIGLPGLILALEPNEERVKNQFGKNIRRFAAPTGVAISVAAIVLSVVAELNDFSHSLLITLSAILVFALDFILLYRISRPLNLFRGGLLALILVVFLVALLVPPFMQIFEFQYLF